MGFPERIRALYTSYIEKAEDLERNRKFGDGLFGLRPGPADDPCHERFRENLAELLKEYTDTTPDSAEVRQILEEIYLAPKNHPEPLSSYWMLVAVHGLTDEAIGLLSPQDAAALMTLYEKTWPRRNRFPAQTRILKLMKQISRQA
ncbi:MAG: hypothetical protein K6C12_08885 [Oscillospiraceae bacterium]|nr:hypothetical protein [Oscillospiraceae bacterium]